MRAELRATVEHLSAIERPSASPGEREAADWIAERFRAAGVERVRLEEERSHGGFWWPVGLLNVAALAGALLPRRRLGRALAVAATAALVDDVDGRARAFRSLLPRRPTWNVTAETGDADAARTIVIVAHHDAAHGGAIFDTRGIEALARRFPKLLARQKRWPPMMWGVVIGPLLVALGKRRAGAVWSAGAAAAMADIGRTPVVPGANDNAAAVAVVLELAKRAYQGIRVLLVSTGSEEANAEGMREWGRRHFPRLPMETTEFVALETLGSGNLAVAEGEGFLVSYPYDAELRDAASQAARTAGVDASRGLVNSFISDAIVPLQAGYPTIMLGAVDDLKLPSNYHKPWDTPEKLDYGCVEDAVKLLDALIRARAAAST
jgi:acetylornithine deacetylase/succinyl-diaminopimelate desuccinylase-like protein